MAVDIIKQTEAVRAALVKDARSAYDAFAPAVFPPNRIAEREAYLHPLLMALSGLQAPWEKGNLPTTRTFLEAEPRWTSLLVSIARDGAIHADYRVRALAYLSRIQAPEPREMILDFAKHTDFEDLAEILRAYKDRALLEAFVAKLPKAHQKELAMFIDLPKPKPTKAPPKMTTKKPIQKKPTNPR